MKRKECDCSLALAELSSVAIELKASAQMATLKSLSSKECVKEIFSNHFAISGLMESSLPPNKMSGDLFFPPNVFFQAPCVFEGKVLLSVCQHEEVRSQL